MSSLKRKTLETLTADLQSPEKSRKGKENGDNQPIRVDEPVACLHDVSYAENYVQSRPQPQPSTEKTKPVKEFPFELDPFQSEVIKCLDNGEFVMGMASTHSGEVPPTVPGPSGGESGRSFTARRQGQFNVWTRRRAFDLLGQRHRECIPQGTTMARHYHVLFYEIGFSPDSLQVLEHELSYICTCTLCAFGSFSNDADGSLRRGIKLEVDPRRWNICCS